VKQQVIKPLYAAFCLDVARLHIEGIPTGFISSLGLGFVTAMYEAIAEDKNSFGFVAAEEDKIVGFVAFTTNLSTLYEQVIFHKGFKFAFVIVPKLVSLRAMKKVWQNLFYPSKMKKMELPDAELLSIAVSPEGRGKGFARQLIEAGLEECRNRGMDRVKVLVAEFNEPANTLYQKCGFVRVCQVDSHGVLSNIYVIALKNENT
jgi:ribosomal protein S18 acetylase RimI-like enzyme